MNGVCVNNASLVEIIGDELEKRLVINGKLAVDFVKLLFAEFVLSPVTNAFASFSW